MSGAADDVSRCAELDIDIERRAQLPERFTVSFRVKRPDDEAEDGCEVQDRALDREALRGCGLDAAKYGAMLTELVFGAPAAAAAFARARAAGYVRVRLHCGPTAPDLHDLRWETLRDPDRPGSALLTDPQVLFSRYLTSADWRPVRLLPREARALVVIADPQGLGRYGLAAVDVAGQLARVRASLGAVTVDVLATDRGTSPPRRVTLDAIREALRAGPDVLYLVCHGQDVGGHTRLFLEDEAGDAAPVEGEALVQVLHDGEQRPRLVVLAACEGAGAGTEASTADGGALVALGPRLLAGAGVPAVLAMQGQVRVRTVEAFAPVFFRELARDGVVDRALAVARGAITAADEAWRPALFMRLRLGRLWYQAGFGAGGLANWAAIRMKIEDGECTPILGPGLFEAVFAFRSRVALAWARKHGFPLAPSQREDLSAVAQYLAARQGPDFPHKQLVKELAALVERLQPPGEARPLQEALTGLRTRRFAGRVDPYRTLAAMPAPVFILGTQDPLLVDALRERGKRPQVGLLPWRRDIKDPLPAKFEPRVEQPLVYHLFGSYDAPKSLVLTQDDYVDFLLSVQQPEVREAIPKVVLERLVDTSLLFLGFQIDSWEFRTVFRTVMQQEARAGFAPTVGPHIAAQVEPEEGSMLDPVGAHAYFQRYLLLARMDIYWGTPEGFLGELAGGGR